MRAVLSRIATHRAVGLALGEHELTISKVASTPVGPVVRASTTVPYTAETLPEVLERVLLPLLGRKRRTPLAVGMAYSRVFYATRRATGGDGSESEQLQGALSSANLSVDDFVIDSRRGQSNKLPVMRIAACRRNHMAQLVNLLRNLGIRPHRVEPTPCALVRLAERQYRGPRRAKTVLRVFLGSTHGLAVLIDGGLPVAWRTFGLPQGTEARTILSAARGLTTLSQHHGLELSLDYVIVHGRTDLHERLQAEQFPTEIETRVIWKAGPTMSSTDAALGLALGCFAPDPKAFDLSRTLKPAPPIKEIFPWGELAAAGALIGAMTLLLSLHLVKLEESHVNLQAKNGQHSYMTGADIAKLEKEQKTLESKIDAAKKFLESRILWSTYTSDMSSRLPPHSTLVLFSGKNELPNAKKKAPPGTMQFQGKAPLEEDGSIPRDVDALLSAAAKDPHWKKTFASTTTEIKLPLSSKKELTEVDFAILSECQSKTAGKPKAAAAEKKEAK